MAIENRAGHRPDRAERGPALRTVLRAVPAPRPAGPTVRPGYDLSLNESPYPPLPGVMESAFDAARGMQRYPDMACGELTDALARHYSLPPSHLATGTGSVGIAQSLIQATAGPGDEVLFAWRSFEAYPALTRVAGATPVPVPLTPGAAHDLDAMAAAITPRTRLIFVCNPNNPTGTAIGARALEAFIDRVPDDVLVVLDEAYREFVRDPDVPDGLVLYRDRPNVCVLRTFSKAYGLAGLRVGFAAAHEPVALALRKTAVPFGVNTVAQQAAIASLRAEDDLLARVATVVAERTRVQETLLAQGWPLPPSQANFVWLPLGERSVEYAAACEEAGVRVRPFADEGVRATMGTPEANDLLLGVSEEFRKRM